MKYEKHFMRYGSPSNEAEITLRYYLTHPRKLTADKIPWYDERATSLIQSCETLIEDMREYRQALAARYAELNTAAYTLRLELKRTPAYNGHGVSFDIRIVKRYEDGTDVDELHEHFIGQERREALARFEDLKKQRPGIEIRKDIARRCWER